MLKNVPGFIIFFLIHHIQHLRVSLFRYDAFIFKSCICILIFVQQVIGQAQIISILLQFPELINLALLLVPHALPLSLDLHQMIDMSLVPCVLLGYIWILILLTKIVIRGRDVNEPRVARNLVQAQQVVLPLQIALWLH